MDDWDFNGVYPIGVDSSGSVFYGRRGIKAFAGDPRPGVVLSGSAVSTLTTPDVWTVEGRAVNTVAYQWQVSTDGETWTDLPEKNKADLTVTYPHEAGISGSYYYRVLCYGWLGTAISSIARVDVTYHLPTIVVAASAQTVTAPGDVTFSATVDYTTTIKWQESTDGETWTDIEGEVSNSYTKSFTETDEPGTYYYRAVVTGLGGYTTSEEFAIEVSVEE